jgi:uncharacterized membrane protein
MSQASPVEQLAGNRLVFEESVEVKAPVEEVYRRWTDFTHFPAFMSNVREVRALGSDLYHWSARIFGVKQEWDAEVTEQEPDRRISWRSINGAYNSGTVSLSPLPSGSTEVRVRLEYTPPAGRVGQQLDKLTQTTRREVKEDLNNFKRLVTSGEGHAIETPVKRDVGGVITATVAPLAGAATGAITAWLIARGRPTSMVARSRKVTPTTKASTNTPIVATSWSLAGLSLGSVIGAAVLRSVGQHKHALFVGQWAPTLVQASALTRLMGTSDRFDVITDGAAFAVTGAGIGSLIASSVAHARGKRYDGLFVGQWVPTFIGTASLLRLLRR